MHKIVVKFKVTAQNCFYPLSYLNIGHYIGFYHVYCKDQSNAALLFYGKPYYVILGYEKWYTSLLLAQCEEICTLEDLNVNLHVDFKFRSGVDLVYLVFVSNHI